MRSGAPGNGDQGALCIVQGLTHVTSSPHQLGERSQVIYEKQDTWPQGQGMVPSFLRQPVRCGAGEPLLVPPVFTWPWVAGRSLVPSSYL